MSLSKLRVLTHLATQSKISKLDVIRLIDENVSGLNISVKDLSTFSFLISRSIVAVLKS